jgi:hypothetical protein
MLENYHPALQIIVTLNLDAIETRFADVEDELGLVVADMGQGGDVPGGLDISLWGAFGTSSEDNRTLNCIIAALAE